jgi:hypothetical protein
MHQELNEAGYDINSRNNMSIFNIEQFRNETCNEDFVQLEASTFAEVARALVVGFGTMLLLGIGTYLVVFVLSTVLAARPF